MIMIYKILYVRKVPQGYVWLQGDNIFDSIDSRDYGPVPLNDVTGIVRFKVKRKENL